MPGVKEEIDQILVNEGGAKVTNDPNDRGSRTQYGISETSNPGAWADGKVTEQEARDIYTQKYLVRTNIIKVADPRLQAQLLDWGVNSGPSIAIKALQGILGVSQDGVLGTGTLGVISTKDSRDINNKLVAARILMICRIVQKDISQVKYLAGWCDRALQFQV